MSCRISEHFTIHTVKTSSITKALRIYSNGFSSRLYFGRSILNSNQCKCLTFASRSINIKYSYNASYGSCWLGSWCCLRVLGTSISFQTLWRKLLWRQKWSVTSIRHCESNTFLTQQNLLAFCSLQSSSWIGTVFACICAFGLVLVWAMWHRNFVWLSTNIFKFVYNNTASSFKLNIFSFRAGVLSGLQGVIAMMTSYYGQNRDLKDIFKGSSRWTLVVGGRVTIVSAVLWLVHYLLLKKLQQKHDNKYGKQQAGRHGEGTSGKK